MQWQYTTTTVASRNYGIWSLTGGRSFLGLPNQVPFHLIDLDTFVEIDTIICQGQSYEGYATTGIYADTLVSFTGCDSIRWLNLMVGEISNEAVDLVLCDAQEYQFGNRLLTQSGMYNDTLISQLGCDSIVTLTLSLVNTDFLGPDYVDCDKTMYQIQSESPNTVWLDGFLGEERLITESGTYIARYLYTNGCLVYDTINVNLQVNHYEPTVFSPNDDNINDTYIPFLSNTEYSSFQFSIFDRWGNHLFYSDNLQNAWNGVFRGEPCPEGVYTYFFQLEREGCPPMLISGDVLLLR